ncbi:MAG: CoB--CoM heterodisulfide reductase iron-sulfur subunit B family protein [Promethearchaeia archaeon]
MSSTEPKDISIPEVEKHADPIKYSFFLGCVIPNREVAYEISTRRVCKELGIELLDMKGASCCGLPVDPVSHESSLALAARNLTIAEEMGHDIFTICTGCTGILAKANSELKENRRTRERVNAELGEIGREFKGTIEVKHLVRSLVEDFGLNNLRKHIKRPLKSLKIAGHYGCHVLMPSKYLRFDDPGNPHILNELIELTGAELVRYEGERDCCGAMILTVNTDLPSELAATKLHNVKRAGVDALTTICPSCHRQYDGNQRAAEKRYDEEFGVPVLHYPQLLGLALGIPPEELALNDLKVKPTSLVEKLEREREQDS